MQRALSVPRKTTAPSRPSVHVEEEYEEIKTPAVARNNASLVLAKRPPVGRGRKSRGRKAGRGGKRRGPRNMQGWLDKYSLRDGADAIGAVVKWGAQAARVVFNVEEKMVDTNNTTTAITSAGQISGITLMAQGSDYNLRQGNSIALRSLRLSYFVSGNTSVSNGNYLRTIVVRDLECSGSAPTLAGLLETTFAGDAINSPFLHYVADRYEVLYDEVDWVMATQTMVRRKIFIPFPEKSHVLWSGTGGTVASAFNGHLFLVLLSLDVTDGPFVNWYSRVTFVDN